MKTTVGTFAAVAVLGLLAGCGQSASDAGGDADTGADSSQAPGSDGQAAAPAEPCPARLPGGEDGFGPVDPAAEAPDLAAAETAWVCRYESGKAWKRDGEAVEVPADALAGLEDSLGALEPADADQMCTQELGPRWMVVLDDGSGGRTGVVVDDFGCDDVRLTDDPASTVPGEARGSAGTVDGVLSGPGGLARDLEALYQG